ncbi:MAG TPA: TonB-dependent siderophore receptor [Vicinamibacterales bacterium]|jgi:catecholate siderophore receptor
MKAREHRKQRRGRSRSPWLVIGAVVGSLPPINAAERRPSVIPPTKHTTVEADPVHAALQDPPVFRFAIAAGPLRAAFQEFQRLTGLTVRVADDVVRDLTTAGVSGVLSATQALDRLLAGTSLSHRFLDPSTVTIELRVDAAAVEVSGVLPRVVSPRYAAPLTETPQTIQVIPRALIDEQGASTLSDALRNVPGITMQAGEGGGASNTTGDMFNMRGFSANNSLFVDGVRDDGLIARDVFNLEQIEVFSGPTGADVGRANAAGYINLTTKTPAIQRLRAGTFSYGAGDHVRATIDVNHPIALGRPGTFLGSAAVRVNALVDDGGVAGRDFVERGSKSIAPSIAFGLGTATRATLSGQIMRQDNLADYGLPAAASPIGPLTPGAALGPAPVDQDTYYGSPDVDYDRVRQDNVMLRFEHDIHPGLTLRNQARYNKTTRRALITSIGNAAAYDAATNRVTLSRQANERDNDIFSNHASLTARPSIGGIRHDLSAGLELTRERQLAPTLTGVGTRAPIDLNHPDVFSPVTGTNIVRTGALTDGSTDTAAVYVFDAFDLGSRVRLSGGVRVEAYETRSHAISATGVVTDLSARDVLVSGKAGLVYRLNRSGNVYASFGSSITPPGSANFQLNASASNQNNPNVDPQESTNYEVGTKWDVRNSRLQLSGAYFYTENENVIFVADAAAVPPIFNQDDEQRVKGVALGVVGRITPRWDVNLSVQYLDSEVASQNPALDRRRLTLTPEVSGSLWTTVRLPREIRLGGGVRYLDRTFVNAANTIVIPGYTVADALVEVPINQRLTLRLNAHNVTDRVYIRNINNNGGRYNPGTPRSFLLSTSVRF